MFKSYGEKAGKYCLILLSTKKGKKNQEKEDWDCVLNMHIPLIILDKALRTTVAPERINHNHCSFVSYC